MAENKFIIKGNNADEYFKITREEFLTALKRIREDLKEYAVFGDAKTTIQKIAITVQTTIGGL
jgi:hypothetical protein